MAFSNDYTVVVKSYAFTLWYIKKIKNRILLQMQEWVYTKIILRKNDEKSFSSCDGFGDDGKCCQCKYL